MGFIDLSWRYYLYAARKIWQKLANIDAKKLSDGTLRMYSHYYRLITEKENSIVIIEEVDNSIHPSRAKKFD